MGRGKLSRGKLQIRQLTDQPTDRKIDRLTYQPTDQPKHDQPTSQPKYHPPTVLPLLHYLNYLGGLVVRRPPRERETHGSLPYVSRRVIPVTYNWYSCDCPARRLALWGHCRDCRSRRLALWGHSRDCPARRLALWGHSSDCRSRRLALWGHSRDCPARRLAL